MDDLGVLFLELKQAAGILSATDLAQVNDLLIKISQSVHQP